MRLLHILIGCLVLTLGTSPNITIAAPKSPWVLPEAKRNKPGKGMVIIALDDSFITDRKLELPENDFELRVTSFDPDLKRPHLELHWVSSPNLAEFNTVVAENGRRYLVGPIGQGEVLIVSYNLQSDWRICYNRETFHFFVKEGTYNFIGRYDPWLARGRIEHAVRTGQMPSSVSQSSSIPPIQDVSLDGFTPANDLPDVKAELENMAAQAISNPVTIITPELKATHYALSRNRHGQPSCT
jgi:hypothetical protein